MTAYIPGLPGPRSHAFHAKAPPTPTPASVAPPPVSDSTAKEADDDNNDADVQITRTETSTIQSSDRFGSGGSVLKLPNPLFKGGFIPNLRRPEMAAQEMADSNVNRYSRTPPRKDSRAPSRPNFPPIGEEAPPEPSPQSVIEEHLPETPVEEVVLDETVRRLVEQVPSPYKMRLVNRCTQIPTHLLQRCLMIGCRAEMAPPEQQSGGYCLSSRRLRFTIQELANDFFTMKTLAQAIDHALGGDELASRRSLAVLASLPGPGWKAEDFFAQELARYFLGQRGSPLDAYVGYLCKSPVTVDAPGFTL